MNAPPYKNDIGITSLCEGPNILRTTWGAARSTNPMTPVKATDTPVRSAQIRIEMIFVFFESTPIACEEGLRFAIREGGRTVGSGVVTKILEA